MQTTEDVKRLQDSIDNLSSFGEKVGLSINKFFKAIWKNLKICCAFLFFGVGIGLFLSFIRGLAGIKTE